jgi:chromate transporter
MQSQDDRACVGLPPGHPTLREALAVWLRIGLLGFGGPAGQIALMHRELVEKRRWLSDRRFLRALNYCMLLPGPEAQQLAVYSGWLLHGTRGGIIAGALFVLPGALLMWVISYVYVLHGHVPWVESVFYGLKAAVMAIILAALLRIGGKVLTRPLMWAIALAALIAMAVLKLPFPAVVLTALALGLVTGRKPAGGLRLVETAETSHAAAPTLAGTLGKIGLWLVIWLLPLAACVAWLGPSHVLAREAAFFSKAALLTFGGAYAVLPYVAQQAVETHAWLTPGQMMDGLGLAETTPGPLILVLQFVGFLGAWREPGGFSPLAAATLGAAITIWATFVPGYLFIFAGAPFIERSHGNVRLEHALAAVTAAVVGVIANLALWFGWNVVRAENGGFDPLPLALAAVFFYLLHWKKSGVITIVGLGALAGLAFAP